MKFSSALSAVLVLLPLTHALAIPVDSADLQRRDDVFAREFQDRIVVRANKKGKGKNNGNKKGGKNNNAAAANNATAVAAANNATAVSAANNATAVSAANNATAVSAANNATAVSAASNVTAVNNATADNSTAANSTAADDGNPQDSLNLLPNLVAPGLAQNGQNPPVAGQIASLTSTNNFINFCIGQTITNGLQVKAGSCNPVPMGDIIPKANMPSSKFTNPINFSTIPANTPFTASIAVQNMDTGFFTNAEKNYFAAPQQLNNGILVAHSHIVIQALPAADSTAPLDPTTFAFFKGLNAPAVGGVLSASVAAGLPAGNYRMASIHTSANHAPAVAAVAQHGFFDDMVYFTAA